MHRVGVEQQYLLHPLQLEKVTDVESPLLSSFRPL